MKNVIIGAALLLTSFLVTGQNLNRISTEERVYGLSKFWQEVNYNFAFFENVPELDFDALYQSYIPKVIAVKNDYEYYRLLQQFCARLKDGHTNVRFPEYINKALCYPRIKIGRFKDKIHIVNVGASYKKEIPRGSEIVKVNGIDVLDYLDTQVYPYFTGSKHTVQNQGAKKMLIGLIGSEVFIDIKTPKGKYKKVEVAMNGVYEDWIYPVVKKSTESISFKILENGIGYLELTTFFYSSELEKQFKEILPKLYGVKKLIIDVRRNGGGSASVANELVKYLTDKPYFYGGRGSTRKHLASRKAWGQTGDSIASKKMGIEPVSWAKKYIPYYHNDVWEMEEKRKIVNDVKAPKLLYPLVVLISNNTASAAEDFLVSLDGAEREATLIGQTTYGSTGQPLYVELPKGGYFRVCTRKTTYPDGRKYVGVGIKPNIEIHPTVTDYLEVKDVVLEKAIAYLRQKK